jgi:quercetin 2,3-dioxygenase
MVRATGHEHSSLTAGAEIERLPSTKSVLRVQTNPNQHWVGDGFPVRTLFFYGSQGSEISPFLLLDLAGPHDFKPASEPRGVGQHPHRGFETVTIVYDGEVTHRDSTGEGGTIGPGDVQWMTAGSGVLHEEFHSLAFTRSGGPFRMVQLWVNLPAADKMTRPRYQSILSDQIPSVTIASGAGSVRVIAGNFEGHQGPAKTFTPLDVWDVRLNSGASTVLPTHVGYTTMLVVLSGRVTLNGGQEAAEAEVVILNREGAAFAVQATSEAMLLVLSGEPINEPIAGHGPFVMNTEAEIHRAFSDFDSGRFGKIDRARH